MTTTAPVDPLIAAVNTQIGRVGPGLFGVACSGGADSLALAHAAIRVAGAPHVVVLSIDHGLSAGSAEASRRVAAWARGQGAAAVVRRVEVVRRGSLEAAARKARYAALDALGDELGLACILLGHTARDQAETVLLRLLRGTGPAGLAAIPAARGRYLRPLLALERSAIDAYVRAHALPVWDDPMNSDRSIARVRVREEILPALQRENPQLSAALVRLARSASEWLEVIDALAAPFARAPIDCEALARKPAAIRKRAVSLALDAAGLDYDAAHLERLDRLVTAPGRGEVSIDVPGGTVVRSYSALSITPSVTASVIDAHAPHDAAMSPLTGPSGARGDTPEARSARSGEARDGRKMIIAPAGYELRTWRAGDRMRPARLKGRSRKLSDLYIDAKVPRAARVTARVLVRLCDTEIVWAEHLGAAFGEVSFVAVIPQ